MYLLKCNIKNRNDIHVNDSWNNGNDSSQKLQAKLGSLKNTLAKISE